MTEKKRFWSDWSFSQKFMAIVVACFVLAWIITVILGFFEYWPPQEQEGFETKLVESGELSSGEKFTKLAIHREKGDKTSEVLYYVKVIGGGETMVADFNNDVYSDIGITDINGSCPILGMGKGESCSIGIAIKANENTDLNSDGKDINLHTFQILERRNN